MKRKLLISMMFAWLATEAPAQEIRCDPPAIWNLSGGQLNVIGTIRNDEFAVVFVGFGGVPAISLGGGPGPTYAVHLPVPVLPPTSVGRIEFIAVIFKPAQPQLGVRLVSAFLTIFEVRTETQCVAQADPNRERTDIGIGERVNVRTNPAVILNWAVDNGGTVAPAMGANTVFTARLTPTGHRVTGTVGPQTVQLGFNAIAPVGIDWVRATDAPVWVAGVNNIGARTLFDVRITPARVSFMWVEFRENIPRQTWTWPDGTQGVRAAAQPPFGVDCANATVDTVSSGLEIIGRLRDAMNVWHDFAYDVFVPSEYRNAAGTWVQWLATENHPRTYQGAAVATRGRARVSAVANNTVHGGFMGPWN